MFELSDAKTCAGLPDLLYWACGSPEAASTRRYPVTNPALVEFVGDVMRKLPPNITATLVDGKDDQAVLMFNVKNGQPTTFDPSQPLGGPSKSRHKQPHYRPTYDSVAKVPQGIVMQGIGRVAKGEMCRDVARGLGCPLDMFSPSNLLDDARFQPFIDQIPGARQSLTDQRIVYLKTFRPIKYAQLVREGKITV